MSTGPKKIFEAGTDPVLITPQKFNRPRRVTVKGNNDLSLYLGLETSYYTTFNVRSKLRALNLKIDPVARLCVEFLSLDIV